MRIEFPGLRIPLPGSTDQSGPPIADTLAANGVGAIPDERNKAGGVIGEIRGTVTGRRLVRAPGDAASAVDILFQVRT